MKKIIFAILALTLGTSSFGAVVSNINAPSYNGSFPDSDCAPYDTNTGINRGWGAFLTDVGGDTLFNTDFGATLKNGDTIGFKADSGASGLTLNTKYYVVQKNNNTTFKVSLTPGGAAVDITGATYVTMDEKYGYIRAKLRLLATGTFAWRRPTLAAVPTTIITAGASEIYNQDLLIEPGTQTSGTSCSMYLEMIKTN